MSAPYFQLHDALDVQNVAPIPLSLVEQVARYTEARGALLLDWHPQRRELLISTRFGDAAQVHHVKMPLGCRSQLTFFPERVGSATFVPTDGSYFVLSKDVGGNEAYQNYRYDLDSGDVATLTDGVSRNSRGIWSSSGDRMCYTSTRRSGSDTDLYVIDPATPENDRLLAEVSGGGWIPCDWSPDDSKVVVIQYVSITEAYVWVFDSKTGERTRLTEKLDDNRVAFSAAIFSKDGKGLYTVCDRNSEFRQMHYLDLSTGEFEPLTSHISWDIESVKLSSDGKWLAFTANENGIEKLHLLDTQTKAERALPDIPAGLILGLKWHKNSRDLGFTVISARSPADVHSIDIESGELVRWTESETGRLAVHSLSEPELISWPSFDDRAITGFLFRPPAKFTGKRPVIIDIHGGPEGQFQPYFLGRQNFYLNELGVALLFPNVRGSSGYGKTFLKLDDGYLREDSVKDIGALLDWIETQDDLDSARLLVSGGSYGGYMSLAVATHYSERIRASIDIVGISNFVTFLENTKSYRRDLRRVEYGDERDPAMREFLLRISPSNNAERIRKPLFVVHGANDPRVPLSEAQQIVATLEKHDVPVWYMVANDEGHGFSKKTNRDAYFYLSILFIREFLLNE